MKHTKLTTKRDKIEITIPHPHDVLLGRGGSSLFHEGNKNLRRWVNERKRGYRETKDKDLKLTISNDILAQVKALIPPGRFLTKSSSIKNGNNSWFEVDDTTAVSKIKQSLTERIPFHDMTGKKRKSPTESDESTIREVGPQNVMPSISSKRVLRSSMRSREIASIKNQSLSLETNYLDDEMNPVARMTTDQDFKAQSWPSRINKLDEATDIITKSMGHETLIALTPDLSSREMNQTLKTYEYVSSNILGNHSDENDLVSEDSAQRITPAIFNHELHALSCTPELYIEEDSMVSCDPTEVEDIKAHQAVSRMLGASSQTLTVPKPSLLRANSLALSEISIDEITVTPEEEFQNPFEDEEEIFDIVQGLLMQDFLSTETNTDLEYVNAIEPLPYALFEATKPTMSLYTLNTIHHDQHRDLNLDCEIQTMHFDVGTQMDTPLTMNVIENEDAIESLDHDLSAWMKLYPDIEAL